MAIEEYKEAIRLNPNNADFHCKLGSAYRIQKDPKSAISEYKLAIKLDSNNANAHYELGRIYEDDSKVAGIPEYEEALRINPDCKEVRTALNIAKFGYLGKRE